MKLRKLIEELNLFERERIPTEVGLLGIATYSNLQRENCQNPFRDSSSFSYSNMEMDKEV